jgi:hypothetical protein
LKILVHGKHSNRCPNRAYSRSGVKRAVATRPPGMAGAGRVEL